MYWDDAPVNLSVRRPMIVVVPDSDITDLDLDSEAPPPDRYARFLTHVFTEGAPELKPTVFPLTRARTVVGRVVKADSQRARSGRPDIEIADRKMSGVHFSIRVESGSDRVFIQDTNSRHGVEIDGEPQKNAVLRGSHLISAGRSHFALVTLELPAALRTLDVPLGKSPCLELAEIKGALAAPTGDSVLICGPTGSGKEDFARRVHDLSGRNGPFVIVDCGAVSDELILSHLYGHRKGAFTGATTDQDGAFVRAHKGTLFLDEIGELSPKAQTSLLGTLTRQAVLPVGATQPVSVDVRVVAATHRDLTDESRFRADLYGRLAKLPIEIGGLCSRKAEILFGLGRYMNRAPDLTFRAAKRLLMAQWRRNYRDVQAVAKHLDVLGPETGRIDVVDLPRWVRPDTLETAANMPTREELVAALFDASGKVSAVADKFGCARKTIYAWCRSYEIAPADFRRTRCA